MRSPLHSMSVNPQLTVSHHPKNHKKHFFLVDCPCCVHPIPWLSHSMYLINKSLNLLKTAKYFMLLSLFTSFLFIIQFLLLAARSVLTSGLTVNVRYFDNDEAMNIMWSENGFHQHHTWQTHHWACLPEPQTSGVVMSSTPLPLCVSLT